MAPRVNFSLLLGVVFYLCTSLPSYPYGDDLSSWSVSLAGGPSLKKELDVDLYEFLITRETNLTRHWDSGLLMNTFLQGGVGIIQDTLQKTTFIDFGFAFFIHGEAGVGFEGGLRVALLSQEDENGFDLGTEIGFISHGGLKVELNKSLDAFAGIQHISNAGFGEENPGLELAVFKLSYRF